MFESIDRRQVKAESRAILHGAQIAPAAFFAAYLGIRTAISLLQYLLPAGDGFFGSPLSLFVSLFSSLISAVLLAGVYLYCMAIRRGERAELLTLFDGFSFAGKVIGAQILTTVFIALWSMLFVFPGIVATYRYRYTVINLCENPDLGVMEAIGMSKQQTRGYKWQLFTLDLSYFGWILLAGLPAVVMSALVPDPDAQLALLSAPWYLLAESACFFVFSLMYLPDLFVSQLAYHEISVRTSGVSPRTENSSENNFGF